jgi:hypothetical protein
MAGVRVLVSVTAVAVVACAVALSGRANVRTVGQTAKLPSHLVGSWTHFVTAADFARAGVTNEPPQRLSMYVPADGNVAVAEFYVKFSPLSGNRLAISGIVGCGKKKGIYRWKVANRHLTLTKLQDTCKDAVAIFSGVWNRE